MKKTYQILLSQFVLALIVTAAMAQAPKIYWQRMYGSTSNDYVVDMKNVGNNGCVVGAVSYGQPSSHGLEEWYILRTDSVGLKMWDKSLGSSVDDQLTSIDVTYDGGFIISGYTAGTNGDVTGNHGAIDAWIVKLDGNGNVVWKRCYGGTGNDGAYSVHQTTDHGFIICGYTASADGDITSNQGGNDVWVIKTDSVGGIVWQKTYGGTQGDIGNAIKQTPSGYVVATESYSMDGDVTGHHNSIYTEDYWIIKLDPSGTIIWQKSLGGSGYDAAYDVLPSGKFCMVTGFTSSNDGDVSGYHGGVGYGDWWVVKMDTFGNVVWKKCYGGTGNETYNRILPTIDGKFLLSGYSDSNSGDVTNNHGYTDAWVLDIDTNKTLLWQKTLGSGGPDGSGTACAINPDGTIMMAATANTSIYTSTNDLVSCLTCDTADIWVVKLSSANIANTLSTNAISGPTYYCQNDSIFLSFTASGTYNPSNIFTAEMSYKSGNTTIWQPIGVLNATTSGTVHATVLTPNTGSSFKARVVSDYPYVVGSNSSSNVSIKSCMDKPTGLGTSSITSNSAHLAWNAAGCNPLGYELQYKKTTASNWTKKTPLTNSYDLTSLIANTTYNWKVHTKCTSSGDFSPFGPKQTFTTSPRLSSDEESTISGLSVFPNPVSDVAIIQFNCSEGSNVTLTLVDLQGRTVSTLLSGWMDVGSHQVQLNSKGLSSGVYVLRMQTSDKTTVEQIVVQ